ncbi:hypothetical protein CDAR_195791 [Caerostris darwini]|uniref:Uncharacterized protein n=1 Tax=Caerostris darwini TaxID=1538125 RepID=A0AAV4S265_9ARAC|nr:hypothetical protein CDAR_195791 [Caerostris darwini]
MEMKLPIIAIAVLFFVGCINAKDVIPTIEKDVNDAIAYGAKEIANDFNLDSDEMKDINRAAKDTIKYIRKGSKSDLDDAAKAVDEIAKGAGFDIDDVLNGKEDAITDIINPQPSKQHVMKFVKGSHKSRKSKIL